MSPNPVFRDEYKKTQTALDKVLLSRAKIDAEIGLLQTRISALEVLTGAAPSMPRPLPGIADSIRSIIRAAAPHSRTVKEIRQSLRIAGLDLNQQSNPASTIGAVCSSLVDQNFAEVVRDRNRKAWKLSKTNSQGASK